MVENSKVMYHEETPDVNNRLKKKEEEKFAVV